MPLYEYKCNQCGAVFEVIQKFSDASLTVHENCGGAVERLISAPAFQFKGTGWYITDYARGKNGKNGSSIPAKESKPESKPGTSTAKTDTSTKSATPAPATSTK